jgi:antitoxin component YwqK of YwqJK toxin-antitoxin module
MSLFDKNLASFAWQNPLLASRIPDIDCQSLQFCQTRLGELNLVRLDGDHPSYYHSQEGAKAEANLWVDEICPVDIKVIFLYGIGLGYYYQALQQWLRNDPGRLLIILEDDLAVLHSFLETEQASELLKDTQVFIQAFNTPGERDWGKFRDQFDWCFAPFSILKTGFHALKLYEQERASLFKLLKVQMNVNLMQLRFALDDFLGNHEEIYNNFYTNLPYISQAGLGKSLFGRFSHIPALICGAGPSLAKQLPTLKTLEDKALIIASGSSLNILNRHGIMPHFGSCVDPTATQESRFMTNFAYEVPFFYENRFHSGAFSLIHGPRLYISGQGGNFGISSWFDQELGTVQEENVTRGISTSNFCQEIAGALKTNPIIFVGMDLSYTESARYAPGVTAHPADDRKEHSDIHKVHENRILAPGLDDQPLYSKWEWVVEASYITEFCWCHPDVRVINATEGGMKILEVPNMTLSDVVTQALQRQYDLRNWVHAEVQRSYRDMPKDKTLVLEAMRRWQHSLEQSSQNCQQLIRLWDQCSKRVEADNIPDPIESDEMVLLRKTLKGEIAYLNFLDNMDVIFNRLTVPQMKKLEFFPDQYTAKQRASLIVERELGRYRFLQRYADFHAGSVKSALSLFEKNSASRLPSSQNSPLPFSHNSEEKYAFEEGWLTLRDPECDLDIREEYRPSRSLEMKENDEPSDQPWEGKVQWKDGQQRLKAEQYYRDNQLHGPSTFFGSEGQVLAQSWFIHGKRVGKTWQYDLEGRVSSLLRFKEGKLHGKQEYYFPNGFLKTLMHYVDGELEGEVQLYYPSGQLKRELHFSKGKLHGREQMWSDSRQLMLEAEYKNNLPCGQSRTWHANGKLAKEITFYDNPLNFDLYIWNEGGELLYKQLSFPQDVFTDMLAKSQKLKQSIEETTAQLNKLKSSQDNTDTEPG